MKRAASSLAKTGYGQYLLELLRAVCASIEPLTWENAFFGVNSAIVRITSKHRS
ncbi:hypothetical protein ACLB1S_31270 [Escherichia coli]